MESPQKSTNLESNLQKEVAKFSERPLDIISSPENYHELLNSQITTVKNSFRIPPQKNGVNGKHYKIQLRLTLH